MPTLAEEFDRFWDMYPRRVSKQDAVKAYQRARVIATAEDILAGVRTLLNHLPEEMRYVPHAASWLNAGRWSDEYAEVPVTFVERRSCPHTPRCHSPVWCDVVTARARGVA